MKKSTISKILALSLAVMSVVSTASCGLVGGKTKGLKKVKLEHVYRTDYMEAPETSYSYIQDVVSVGGKTYFISYYNKEIDADNTEDGMMLLEADADGKKLTDVMHLVNVNNYDEDAKTNDYNNINAITPCGDGTVWYFNVEGHSNWSDEKNYTDTSVGKLVHANYDGTVISSIDTTELLGENNYIRNLFYDADTKNLIIYSENVIILDETGKTLSTISVNENANFNTFTRIGDGRIVVLSLDYTSDSMDRKLMQLDVTAGQFKDLGDVAVDAYQFIPGNSGALIYFNDNSAIYSYDIDTKEKKEVLNWINSDINSNRINLNGVTPDGRFICSEYDKDYNNQKTAILSPVADGETVEKYVLDFASVYLSDELKDAIISFNKKNEEYRIRYLDYSQYNTDDDYTAGVTKLNNDIIAGNIPDMFNVEQLPLDNYTSKGLIKDLKKNLDSDKDIKAEDYFSNILNITGQDGKIYSIVPSFNLITNVGIKSFVGDKTNVTVEDLIAIRDAHPDAKLFPYYTTRDSFFSYGYGSAMISAYVDAENGNCDFNNASFEKYLDFIKGFPTQDEIDKNQEDNAYDENMFKNGSVLLSTQGIGGFDDFRYVKSTFTDDYVFVNFPMPDESKSGAMINASNEIAVSAKSQASDICWEFIKYMLSDEYQDSITYSMPLKKSAADKMAKKAIEDSKKRAEDNSDSMSDSIAVTSKTGATYYDYDKVLITQDDVDRIYDLVDSAKYVIRDNKEILSIIEEESGAYFAGKKTSAEVASLIQDRVQLYLNENM